jgi:hypothetical protein
MSPQEKKKLAVAGGLFALAIIVFAWSMLGGGGRASRDARKAQDQVLEQMGASQTEPEAPPTPAPAGSTSPGAGRPRSVRPGS